MAEQRRIHQCFEAWDFQGPWHQSMISLYLTCPKQFKLRYVDNIRSDAKSSAMCAGTAMHGTIATMHTDNAFDHYEDIFQSEWDAVVKEDDENKFRDTEAAKLPGKRIEGLEIVKQYSVVERDAAVTFVEVPFEVEIGGEKFAGTIDQIRQSGDEIQLVDLKSNLAAPSSLYLEKNLQFSIYAYGILNGILKPPSGDVELGILPVPYWYHLRNLLPYKKNGKTRGGRVYKKGDLKGNPMMKTPRNEADMEKLVQTIGDITKAIKMGVFFERPSSLGSCVGFCQYHAACNGEYHFADNAIILPE